MVWIIFMAVCLIIIRGLKSNDETEDEALSKYGNWVFGIGFIIFMFILYLMDPDVF